VLTVVYDRSRGVIDKRVGSPTEELTLLEEKNGNPAGGEVNGGGKAAEASADDDNRVQSVWGLGWSGRHERPSQEYFSVLLSQ
jgi:hypothetical protein